MNEIRPEEDNSDEMELDMGHVSLIDDVADSDDM